MRQSLLRPLLYGVLLLLVVSTAHAAELGSPLVYGLKGAVMLRDGAGGTPVQLGQGHSPTLSPDGRQIAWIAYGDAPDDSALILYSLDTRTKQSLVRISGALRTVCWSPSGDRLLYACFRDGQSELWTINIGQPGSAPVRLAVATGATGDDFFEPVWSPDGASIYYHDMSQLYRMALDGKVMARTDLATFSGRKGDFTSADRLAPRPGNPDALLFSACVPGTPLFQKKVPDVNTALFLYDATTKKRTRLTPEQYTAFAPVWSPDGKTILFTGYTDVQAGGDYPFRVFSLRPGEAPVELFPGESPSPAPAK